MAALTIASEPASEPISLDEAKRHLRRLDSDLDGEIVELIASARDYCERATQRTLRVGVERLMTLESLPICVEFPWPPLISVDSVKYLDAAGDEQTLDPANYYVELSTEGAGVLRLASGIDLPATADREDAWRIALTTGYASADAVPSTAKQAIKQKLTEFYGLGSEKELMAAAKCADRLLSTVEWTVYA
jgi:uncharacterized phiE125 gp8 family phage protein